MLTMTPPPSHRCASTMADEVPLPTEISFLQRDYQFLLQETAANTKRFSLLDEQLRWLMKVLDTQSTDTGPETIVHSRSSPQFPHHFADSSSVCHQVYSSSLERHDPPLDMASRDTTLKTVEMPSFDGSNTHKWLVDIEHFFAFGQFREEDKLDIVALCVEGKVKNWFVWVLRCGGFQNWLDFKQKLIVRFAESSNAALSPIKQSGYVLDSISTLQELSSPVVGLPNSLLEKAHHVPKARDCLLPMGITSESIAARDNVISEEQDMAAVESHKCDAAVIVSGTLHDEIFPLVTKIVDLETKAAQSILVSVDDGVHPNSNLVDLTKLTTVFKPDGSTITCNASQISDGDGAVRLMKKSLEMTKGLPFLGEFISTKRDKLFYNGLGHEIQEKAECEQLEKSVEPSLPKLVEPLAKYIAQLSVDWGMINHLKAAMETPELRAAIKEVQPGKVKFRLKHAEFLDYIISISQQFQMSNSLSQVQSDTKLVQSLEAIWEEYERTCMCDTFLPPDPGKPSAADVLTTLSHYVGFENMLNEMYHDVRDAVPETKALTKDVMDLLSGGLPKGINIQTKHLEALIALYNVNGFLARNIQHLFAESDLRVLINTFQAVYSPTRCINFTGGSAANEAVFHMLSTIRGVENIPEFIVGVKNRKRKMSDFGHHVYKYYGLRAHFVDEVFSIFGRETLLEVVAALEKALFSDAYFVKKRLYPNVVFYSGLIYRGETKFKTLKKNKPTMGGSVTFLDLSADSSDAFATRHNATDGMELLVNWMGKHSMEEPWMSSKEFLVHFPSYKLEGKLGFVGGSIDRFHNAYYKKKMTQGMMGKQVTGHGAKESKEAGMVRKE